MNARSVRGPVGRAMLLLVLSLTSWSSASAAAPSPAGTKPSPAPSTRNSPGWYPNVDPESSSVRLGRRTSAPLVSMPFDGGARSLDDLGRTICRLLHHRDQDSLMALCIQDTEFRTILWREFPQSRPATGLQWEDGWRVLDMRLRSGVSDALGEHGGRYYQFLRFERPETPVPYKNFKLHSGLVMVVKNDAGEIERFGWLRSVAERKGRFKIYSMSD